MGIADTPVGGTSGWQSIRVMRILRTHVTGRFYAAECGRNPMEKPGSASNSSDSAGVWGAAATQCPRFGRAGLVLQIAPISYNLGRDSNHFIHETRSTKKMSDSKVTGNVHLIEETKTYGQKGFRKRLVVLEQDKGSFTNYVPVEFVRDSCDAVDELNVGDEVEITYRLNGRRWQKDPQSEVKFFLNAEAMAFQIKGSGSGAPTENVRDVNDAFAEAGDDEAPF